VNSRARSRRAQASSLYLLFYHVGSSLLGVIGGLVYGAGGWSGLVVLLALPLTVAVAAALSLPGVVVPRAGAIDTGSEP
jgi:YNFM family putative membrane transporter